MLAMLVTAWPKVTHAAQLSELMYDLDGSDDKREWLEVYNDSLEPLSLDGWSLTIGDEQSRHNLTFESDKGGRGDKTLPPGASMIIASDGQTFMMENPSYTGSVADSVLSLPNYSASRTSPISLRLFNTEGVEQVTATYLPVQSHTPGKSIEWSDGQWLPSLLVGGTPGSPRQASLPITYGSFRLVSLLPNPVGSDTDNEYVEIENYGSNHALLSQWYVADRPTASGAVHKQVVPDGVTVAPGSRYLLKLSGSFLNNSDETITLYRPDGYLVEEVAFTEAAEEGVSYHRVGDRWQWSNKTTQPETSGAHSPSPMTSIKASASSLSSKPSAPSSTRSPSPKAAATKTPTPKPTSSKKGSPSPPLPEGMGAVAGLTAGPPTVTLPLWAQICLAALLIVGLVISLIYRFGWQYRLFDWVRYAILRKK